MEYEYKVGNTVDAMAKIECKNVLIMIMGLPGSGKTYLARRLASVLNAEHLNSDILRRHLDLRGHYSMKNKEKVYREMLDKTVNLLGRGICVIVDATFYKKAIREAYEKMAEQAGAKIYRIMAVADEKNIRKRVSKKRPDSEADYEVYRKVRDAFEEVESQYLTIHTDRAGDSDMIGQVMQYLDKINDKRGS